MMVMNIYSFYLIFHLHLCVNSVSCSLFARIVTFAFRSTLSAEYFLIGLNLLFAYWSWSTQMGFGMSIYWK